MNDRPSFDVESYLQGLTDAIEEIESEMACVEESFGDMVEMKAAAMLSLKNARLLICDRIKQSRPKSNTQSR